MRRTYSVRAVALTTGLETKWLDNLLSHFDVPGVERGRRGWERRVSDQGLLAIEIIRIANSELGVPLPRAVPIAQKVLSRPGGEFHTLSGAVVLFPLTQIEQRLRERMVAAVESVPRITRGRPRRA